VVKAAKCDLCVEQLTGPACVQACPHDALTRVDMQDTQKLAKWLQR
jgi:Fe-S-cluster-containing hydrogenase component 2